jgi:hypothetical protein
MPARDLAQPIAEGKTQRDGSQDPPLICYTRAGSKPALVHAKADTSVRPYFNDPLRLSYLNLNLYVPDLLKMEREAEAVARFQVFRQAD